MQGKAEPGWAVLVGRHPTACLYEHFNRLLDAIAASPRSDHTNLMQPLSCTPSDIDSHRAGSALP